MTVPFELGEQKHVRLRVCSCKNENFLITAASYELYYRGAKEPEDTGHSEIQEHILDTLIQPKKKGIEVWDIDNNVRHFTAHNGDNYRPWKSY